jgi:hypothetical protein
MSLRAPRRGSARRRDAQALCSIVCWLSLLVCVFLSSGHIAVPIASVALAIVALIGLYGATPTRYPPEMRNPPFDISAQLVGMVSPRAAAAAAAAASR